jgi:hypothetical protein
MTTKVHLFDGEISVLTTNSYYYSFEKYGIFYLRGTVIVVSLFAYAHSSLSLIL